jgi:hypothetical protein
MSVSQAVGTRFTRALRNDTTRYLCAAAHLDAAFADNAVREFLTEPLRAVPPSPGVDSTAVLREAVAARTRRKVRDWTLLVLFLVFAGSSPLVALAWLVVGIVMTALSASTGWIRSVKVRRVLKGIALVVLLGLLCFYLVVTVVLGVLGAQETGAFRVPGAVVGPTQVVLALAALTVTVLDRFALSYLLTRSFRRDAFTPKPTVDEWPGERWVRTLGENSHQAELKRVEDAVPAGNLVLYRGYHPFIGAGVITEPMSYVIPLEPAELPGKDATGEQARKTPKPFTLAELYDEVSCALMALRDSPSLAPSNRLAGLTEQERVVVPVEEMLVNLGDPATRSVLPRLDKPPEQTVSDDQLADLIEHPLEWMRYYRCYQVETWDRDVTISVYLHFGVSERTLYLEWLPCLLFPIADRYRVIDTMRFEPLGPLRDGLVDWVRMPGALLTRLGAMTTRIKAGPARSGTTSATTYGAGNSLRELASGKSLNNYFQRADVSRYMQVLGARMVRAVGSFLDDRNIAVTEFKAQVQTVVSQYTYIGGDVINSAVGKGNTVSDNQVQGRKPGGTAS